MYEFSVVPFALHFIFLQTVDSALDLERGHYFSLAICRRRSHTKFNPVLQRLYNIYEPVYSIFEP